MNIAEIWEQLELEPGGSGLAVKRIYPESKFNLHLGLEMDSRLRQLRYGRPWKPADRLPTLPTAQGIQCRGQLHSGGREMTLVVELLDPALADVFTPVVEDLVGRIVASADDAAATRELSEGLARWQELFEALAQSGMGVLVRRGLAGELFILRDLLLVRLSPDEGLGAWTGPLKANQDFQRPAIAIEVKVTTGKQPQGFVVASERELDNVGTGTLAVAHISMDERRGGDGSNLNSFVGDIARILVGHPAAESAFREKLARVGYLHKDRELYNEPHYEVRKLQYFEVSSAFPRIVEAGLPVGVGDVRYTVALAACADFVMETTMVEDLVLTGATQ